MHALNSLGIFVGKGICNARCAHCAGLPLREYAPKNDCLFNREKISNILLSKDIKKLTITSSGEPTLSPKSITQLLELVYKLNIEFETINMYSNGILMSNDNFCKKKLPLWHDMGLKMIYITVHNIDNKINANMYGIDYYPDIKTIITNLHKHNILVRANIILSKGNIDNFNIFKSTTNHLLHIGFDSISAWPIRNIIDGSINHKKILNEDELFKIKQWLTDNRDNRIKLLLDELNSDYLQNKKLTLFQNNILSARWCA